MPDSSHEQFRCQITAVTTAAHCYWIRFAHQNVPYIAKGTTVAIYNGTTKLVAAHY